MTSIQLPSSPARTLLRRDFSAAFTNRLRILLGGLAVLLGLLAGPSAHALTVSAVTSDNGYPAHLVQWTDASGHPRTAVMVDQNSTSPGPYTGFLRRYTYQVNGVTRTCTGTYNYATDMHLEFSGDGFVQNHTADGGDYSSGNGAGVAGTTTITLQGTSHAIITFAMPTYKIGSATVPTTVQWFFADGRDHPVFSVSQDARSTSGNLGSDTRTPYGDMAYDGDGLDALVGGFSYGDTYKFVTLAANPEEVTSNSPWKDTDANTIPYTMQWAEPATVDAEMGHVATLPISLCDQGQDTQTSNFDNPPDLFDPRDKTGTTLPPYNTYAYQIINYSLDTDGDPTDSKRLAWGSNFGRIGGFDNYGDTSVNVTQYSRHSDDPLNSPLAGTRADGLLMAYSTFIVLGTHNGSYLSGAVGQWVAQMENTAAATFTASTGTVVTSGPAGVGPASNATITYTPAGYNPTFSAWEVSASQNLVTATLTPASGTTLIHPVIIVDGYTGNSLPTISIDGVSSSGSSYATLDTASQRLWVTVNKNVTSAMSFAISVSDVPVITCAASANGYVGTALGFRITATNNPTSFGSRNLPPGLSLGTHSDGLISGTPTTVGTYKMAVSATNAAGTGVRSLTFTIHPAKPVITSASTAHGDVGTALGFRITASGSPTSFDATGLPPGLTVNKSNALISGTPTTTGTYNVTVSATNASGTGSATLTFTINPAKPVITSASSAHGTVGTALGFRITATGSPTSFNATGLPPGLSLHSDGLISGTPTTAGTYDVTVSATNAGGTGTGTLTFTVAQ